MEVLLACLTQFRSCELTPSEPSTVGNGSGRGNGHAARCVSDLVGTLSRSDLSEAWRFWADDHPGKTPSTLKRLRADVLGWIVQPARVLGRIENLGRRDQTLHNLLLSAPRFELTVGQIVAAKDLAYLSSYELEASLELLRRRALVQECASRRVSTDGVRSFAICQDMGNALLGERRARRRGIFDALTLRGHLDRMYDDPERAARTPPASTLERPCASSINARPHPSACWQAPTAAAAVTASAAGHRSGGPTGGRSGTVWALRPAARARAV